ncbi:MAG: hypothetical protein WD988_00700 [Candidatus Curtissbacteria bacterium]
MEDKRQRFKRLATKRTNSVLEKIRLLGNLSSKVNYEYSEEEINKIFSTIEGQLRIIKTKFLAETKKEFKL